MSASRPPVIAVLGAGGRLGRHVVAEALARGHTVHAAVHQANPLSPHPRLELRPADVHHQSAVLAALRGAELVISCLGSAAAGTADIQAAGARNLVTAMDVLALPRLVSVTGSGARLPGEQLTPGHRIKRQQMLSCAPALLADGDRHLATIAASDLAWTVIRVPRMTRQGGTSRYTIQPAAPHPGATAAYTGAARAMVDLATGGDPGWMRAAPFVTSGPPPRADKQP